MPIDAESTIYTVRDFLNWQRDGTLDLRPPFQRNAVWKPIAKSSLIDSLLRGYPIPALFLQDRTDTRSFHRELVVIDGQQRLRTILAYVDLPSLKDADDRDRFKILKLHDPARAGRSFSELSDEDRHRILGTRLSAAIVDSSVTDSELLEIFRRMNTYGSRLSAQELRNAQYSGYFKVIAYRLSAEALDIWSRWKLFSPQDIAEMRDAEFSSELLSLLLTGTQSQTAKSLNDLYERFEEDFPELDSSVERFHHLLRLADDVLSPREPVRRLTTKMWIYSLIDALQRLSYGGPIDAHAGRAAKRLSVRRVRAGCVAVNEAIDSGDLPADVEKATRGAASDKGSREARATFLLSHIRDH